VPDAIVLDLTMPVRGGLSMVEELQEDKLTRMILIAGMGGARRGRGRCSSGIGFRRVQEDEAFVLAERVSMVLEAPPAVAAAERRPEHGGRYASNPWGSHPGIGGILTDRCLSAERHRSPRAASSARFSERRLTDAGAAESSRTPLCDARGRGTRSSTQAPWILCSCNGEDECGFVIDVPMRVVGWFATHRLEERGGLAADPRSCRADVVAQEGTTVRPHQRR
jgi:hypothetical protein